MRQKAKKEKKNPQTVLEGGEKEGWVESCVTKKGECKFFTLI
jgi:hypothetical protein